MSTAKRTKKKTAEPTSSDVSVPAPEKPSRAFLSKLYQKLKEKKTDLSEDEFKAAVTHARSHAGGMAKAAKTKAASESLTAFVSRVGTALYEAFCTGWNDRSAFSWAKEVYSDHVIACSNEDGKDYHIPFTTGDDGEIEFGEPFEVTTEYVPASVGAHELFDLCAHGHPVRLFMEQSFAEPPDWINYLPKPGEYTSDRYGKISITKERNEEFTNQFNDGIYQTVDGVPHIPIDAEHESKLSGALGWITSMRVNEDGSVDAKPDWTDRGKELIEADRFKFFSPEWYDEWTDPATETTYNNIAIGGALTTRPFFKEKSLRPLVANEKGLFALETGDLENVKRESVVNLHFTAMTPDHPQGDAMVTKEQIEAARKLVKAADAKTATEALKDVTDEQIKAARAIVASEDARVAAEKEKTAGDAKKAAEPPKELAERLAASEAQTKTFKEEAEKNAAEAKRANERVDALEKDSRAKRFGEMATGWVGKKEQHIAMMEHLATSDEKGEESDLFKSYVETQKAAAEQISKSNIFSEIGTSRAAEGSVEAEIEAKAKKMSEESSGKLTYAQAYAETLKQNPSLYTRLQAEERRSVN